MTRPHPIRRSSRPAESEEGFVLISVIFLVALLTIALAIALPKVTKQIQRDRELETMHRGKQYIRGIRMYYKKFGSYPPNMDALVKPTNNIRFMRKNYADPITGKVDWKPIGVGMNKAPTAMGFFGQPLGGVGGCAPNPLATSASSVTSSSSSFAGATTSPTDPNSNCGGAGLNTNTTTQSNTGTTDTPDPNAPNSTTDPNATTSAFGQPGQTFGGMGFMGVSPNSPKQSILVYKKMNHYNGWEFVYDPRADQMMQPGGAPVNVPLQPGAPGVGLPTPPPSPTPPVSNP